MQVREGKWAWFFSSCCIGRSGSGIIDPIYSSICPEGTSGSDHGHTDDISILPHQPQRCIHPNRHNTRITFSFWSPSPHTLSHLSVLDASSIDTPTFLLAFLATPSLRYLLSLFSIHPRSSFCRSFLEGLWVIWFENTVFCRWVNGK